MLSESAVSATSLPKKTILRFNDGPVVAAAAPSPASVAASVVAVAAAAAPASAIAMPVCSVRRSETAQSVVHMRPVGRGAAVCARSAPKASLTGTRDTMVSVVPYVHLHPAQAASLEQ
eukprot:COSAG06_NODE_2311_length_7102_cov_19.326432_6_plen_117_part_01